MKLTRAWSRWLLGASGVALAVPATVLVALVLLALGGGFGHLASVSEVLVGPPLPGSGHGVEETNTALAAGLRAERPGSGLRGTGAGSAAAGVRHGAQRPPRVALSRSQGTTPSVGAPAPARPPGIVVSHPGPRPDTGGPARSGRPSGPARPAPAPPAPSPAAPSAVLLHGLAGAVRSASTTVAAAASSLPDPVGPTAGGAVTSVGGTVASILDGVAGPGAGSSPAAPGVSRP